jgi:hypothetical protein
MFLSIYEVQEILEVSEEEVRDLIKDGKLKTINILGAVLVEQDSLLKWIQKKDMKLRECNLCHKKVSMSKYQRFCSKCRKSDLYRFYKPLKRAK